MPWCPKCRCEYQEGFNKCSDCDEFLVPWLEPLKEESEEIPFENESFLMTATDENEANIIIGLLDSNGIPVSKRHKETGAYMEIYMGMSAFGMDLFVPSSLLEQAREIIGSKPEGEEIEFTAQEQIEQEEYEKNYRIKRNMMMWLFALILIIPTIIFFIVLNR